MRALLEWSQEDLAREAAVSIPTIKRLESSDGLLGGRLDTIRKIRTVLEAAGIKFLGGVDSGPGPSEAVNNQANSNTLVSG